MLLLFVFLLVASGSLSWPQMGHDAQHTWRSGLKGPRKAPAVDFSVDTKEYVSQNIVADGEMIYITGNNALVAINASARSLAWRASVLTQAGVQFAPVLGVHGRIFVQDNVGVVRAYSPGGKLLWSSAATARSGAFCYMSRAPDGNIITSSPTPAAQASVTVLVRSFTPEGHLRWSYNHSVPFRSPSGSCVVDQHSVGIYCIISHNSDAEWSSLVRLDASSGAPVWRALKVPAVAHLSLWEDSLVVLIQFSAWGMGSILAVGQDSGETVLSQAVQPPYGLSPLALTKDGVYVTQSTVSLGNDTFSVQATDLMSGRTQWSLDFDGSVLGCAMDRDERLYIAIEPSKRLANTTLTCIDVGSGRVLWTDENAFPSTIDTHFGGPTILEGEALVVSVASNVIVAK